MSLTQKQIEEIIQESIVKTKNGKGLERCDIKEVESEDDLDESSGMSGGGMAFSSGKQKDYKMIDRKEFIEEMKLRENIQNILKRITEAKSKEDRIPHQSTGINILEDLLKKIIPALEDDYKDLTTSPEQRKSFKAHIVNAVMNDIQRERTKPALEDEEDEMSLSEDVDVSLSDNDIKGDVEFGSDEEDENKFIDIENPTGGIQGNKKSEEDEELDRFSIPGEDETGRNMALETFNTIQKNIMDSYHLLGNEEDIELFTDYLITNLKLYFDKWEDELQTSVPELTTDEYEDKKNDLGSDSVDFGSDDEDIGSEEEVSI